MAIQNYIGWPVNVNQIILDSTTISIGDGALRTDELENGHKQSDQRSPYVPERYSVHMSFDWINEVGNTGKTEYQLFTEWYKYRHKCGSVPFEFPKILYSSNLGIPALDEHQNIQYTEYYKIISSTEGSKSGEHISVNMTWETVYTGAVTIPTSTPSVAGVTAKQTYLDISFAPVSDTAPVTSMISVYTRPNESSNWTSVPVTGFVFDGTSVARLYYAQQTVGHQMTIAINNYAGLNETQGTHKPTVEA